MENGWMDWIEWMWIEWMWKVESGKWIVDVDVESGAVPDLTYV